MDNNNSTVVVIGMIAVVVVLITGKWLIDNKNQNDGMVFQQAVPDQQQVVPQQPNVDVSIYHNDQQFWAGYQDGYYRQIAAFSTPAYLEGYRIGATDRRMRHHRYYDRYYPPGFNLRFPGFNMNIR